MLEVVDDYDFRARVLSVDDAVAVPAAAARSRTLPVMSASMGSFGR